MLNPYYSSEVLSLRFFKQFLHSRTQHWEATFISCPSIKSSISLLQVPMPKRTAAHVQCPSTSTSGLTAPHATSSSSVKGHGTVLWMTVGRDGATWWPSGTGQPRTFSSAASGNSTGRGMACGLERQTSGMRWTGDGLQVSSVALSSSSPFSRFLPELAPMLDRFGSVGHCTGSCCCCWWWWWVLIIMVIILFYFEFLRNLCCCFVLMGFCGWCCWRRIHCCCYFEFFFKGFCHCENHFSGWGCLMRYVE